jgi:hypothetical protein
MRSICRAWGLLIGLAACGGDSAPADGSDTSDSSGGSDPTTQGAMVDDTTTGDACTCMGLPDNWGGPVVLATGDSVDLLPECGGDWATEQWTLGLGSAEVHATCQCACGEAGNIACGAAQLERHPDGDDACAREPEQTINLDRDGCTVAPNLSATGWYALSEVPTTADCPASARPDFDEPAFAGRMRACASSVASTCPLGHCIGSPPGEFESTCIYQEGVAACPVGTPFTQVRVGYQQLVDTRSCGEEVCTCLPEGTCDLSVFLRPEIDCAVSGPTLASGQCVRPQDEGLPQISGVVTMEATAPARAACSPAEAEVPPTGSVAVSEPITFCCTP